MLHRGERGVGELVHSQLEEREVGEGGRRLKGRQCKSRHGVVELTSIFRVVTS